MTVPAVLVAGGYGTFGRLIAASLARHSGLRVIVAGRDAGAAQALCAQLGPRTEAAVLDCQGPDVERRLAQLGPAVVIDTVGPFQGRDYRMARACIATGAHSIDLADDRSYVCGITALDAQARLRGVLVASGASTCPALSTAVVDELALGLNTLDTLELGVAPGQRAPRGLATVRSVLSYCGQPIPAARRGRPAWTVGWSGLTRHRYPAPVGGRWLSRVDLPELDLWPERYPSVRRVDTYASLELSILHLGLTALSWTVRAHLMRSLAPHARALLRISDALQPLGSAVGAMHVAVLGDHSPGVRLRRTWTIVAERGDGPQIPAAPAVALALRLLGGHRDSYSPLIGARPCIGLLSVGQILAQLKPFAILAQRDETPLSRQKAMPL